MTNLINVLLNQGEALGSYFGTVSSVGVVLLDPDLKVQDCNRGFLAMFDLTTKPVGLPIGEFLNLATDELGRLGSFRLSCNNRTGVDGIVCCNCLATDSGLLLFCERLIMTKSTTLEQVGIINNELVNLQRESHKKNLLLEKLKKELAGRVAELEATVAQVKRLEGILPICMYCKKIRDDQSSWHQLEDYISKNSEAEFSHSMCPHCYEEQMEKARNLIFTR